MIYIVWRFVTRPDRVADFEAHYGADGSWAQLFRRHSGFRGTELLLELDQPGSYLLWDKWDALASFDAFKREHAADYAALDRECEALTLKEEKVGIFQLP